MFHPVRYSKRKVFIKSYTIASHAVVGLLFYNNLLVYCKEMYKTFF